MNRRGFALLAVLWVVTALSSVVAAGLAVERLGLATTRNRIVLARGAWAAEACGAILAARYASGGGLRDVDSVDLGRGLWCRATIDDPSARLNLNTATRPQFEALLTALGYPARAATLADTLVNWRATLAARHQSGLPVRSVRMLQKLPGFDTRLLAQLVSRVTVEGTGQINVNSASPAVLATIGGLAPEAVTILARGRAARRPVRSFDELLSLLSADARAALAHNYLTFSRVATFAPVQLAATLQGGVRGMAPTAQVYLTLVPTAGRLAVIRRKTE